jgi:penicillin amidase
MEIKSMKRSYLKMALLVGLVLMVGCLGPYKDYVKQPVLGVREGRVQVPGLKGEVKVYYDAHGIPHIFTEDEHDLFFAVGWVQAQDRLWEMVLLRAMSEGRLCEIFGDLSLGSLGGFSLSMFDQDRQKRILGLKYVGEVGEALLREEDPALFGLLQAYSDGVNAYIESHRNALPVEFGVLRISPEPFRVADIESLGLFIGSMLCGNSDVELIRYAIFKKYGEELGKKLVPLHTQLGPTIVPPELLQNKLEKPRTDWWDGTPSIKDLEVSADAALKLFNTQQALREAAGFPDPLASNNWIVSGKMTANGRAMLANDPHLEHVEPSLFYLMQVKGAGNDAFGAAFPGQPFTVLGHTRNLAWGATTSIADVQDIFVEKVNPKNPEEYLYKGEWRKFTVREETIRVRSLVKKGRFHEKKIKVRQSIHGPIINDMVSKLPPGTPPLALRWVGWDFGRDLKLFDALVTSSGVDEFMAKVRQMDRSAIKIQSIAHMYQIMQKGKSIDDFIKAMDLIVLPNQNWVAADSAGHIAYLPGGLVPIRKKGIGALPAPGWTGEYDWTGFIPLMELPHAIDPERGWMATANNEVVDFEWYPYVFETNYGDGWRAARIQELLQKEKPLTLEKMRRIQNDIYSKEGEWWAPKIVAAVEKKGGKDARLKQAAEILKQWDFETDVESLGATIFYETMRHAPQIAFSDEMDQETYQAWFKGEAVNLAFQLYGRSDPDSDFFDDKRTKNVRENLDDVLVAALKEGLKFLESSQGKDMSQWQWGKVHTIKWYHPLGFGPMKDLSYGPFPHPGANGTVRNAGGTGTGKHPFRVFGGPVLRHLMDLGDPDHALLVIDGSESGRYKDPHYTDLHDYWYRGDYVEGTMDPEQVQKECKEVLILAP